MFDVILADPPWHFQTWNGRPGPAQRGSKASRSAQQYYSTMALPEIQAITLPAADDCVLFLWSCWPLLPDALSVISAWGFEYKTIAWVWVKANRSGFGFFQGLGFYTRSNSEPCLLATRGNPGRPTNRSIQSIIYAPVREHSRKPDDQYRKIEALYPNMRYLELFARRKQPGWDVWGNEVESTVEIR